MKTFKFLILLMSTLLFWNCCNTRSVTCANGQPVFPPRSQQCALKAYKESVKDFNFNLKATLDVAEQVTLGVDNLEIKNESKLLKEKLNQRSIRMQDILKSSYLDLVINPCESSKEHRKLLESVNIFNKDLEELTIKLEMQLKENESEVRDEGLNNTLTDYLYQRGKREGNAMGQLASRLNTYFQVNHKYPESLDNLEIDDLLMVLKPSMIEYQLVSENEYSLKFAGEDYVLGSPDDKLIKGVNGKTERI